MDTKYFQQIVDEETPQAERLASVLIEMYSPKSVVDFGCATGLYLEPFAKQNIQVTGYDNSKEAIALAKLGNKIKLKDLTKPGKIQPADISICLEVLEHIEARDALNVAQTIAQNSKILVFSAAHPGQGGEGHINCRPKEYWEGVFNSYGLFIDHQDTAKIVNYMSQGYHMGWLIMNLMVLKTN